MPTVTPFNQYAVRGDGTVENLHQTSLLRFFSGGTALAWRGGLSIPLFWPTLFRDRAELQGPVVTIEWRDATDRLGARRASWKAKTSVKLLRGFDVFAGWVKNVGGGQVQLDLSGLETWRVAPFLDAAAQLIDFIDDRSTEPGPLLPSESHVCFRKRKGTYRLEALSTDLHWPDELPLFAVRATELQDATTGKAPFRAGPWPERRLLENPGASLPREVDGEIKARAELAARAILASSVVDTKLGVIGNLEGIERMRATWRACGREALEAAASLQASAPFFASRFQVFDDSPLWAKRIEATRRWEKEMEAHLDRHAEEVREAMRDAGF